MSDLLLYDATHPLFLNSMGELGTERRIEGSIQAPWRRCFLRFVSWSYRYAEQILNSKLTLKKEIEDSLAAVEIPPQGIRRPELNTAIEKDGVGFHCRTAPPIRPPMRRMTVFPKVSKNMIPPPTVPPTRAPIPIHPNSPPIIAPAILKRIPTITTSTIPTMNPANAPRRAPRAIIPATEPAISAPSIGIHPRRVNIVHPAMIPLQRLPLCLEGVVIGVRVRIVTIIAFYVCR